AEGFLSGPAGAPRGRGRANPRHAPPEGPDAGRRLHRAPRRARAVVTTTARAGASARLGNPLRSPWGPLRTVPYRAGRHRPAARERAGLRSDGGALPRRAAG